MNNKDRLKKREGKQGDIEEAFFIWFKEKRSQGVMPSGDMLIEKGKQLASIAKIDCMKFNVYWLNPIGLT